LFREKIKIKMPKAKKKTMKERALKKAAELDELLKDEGPLH
jgi:hypothetical protein